MKHGHSNRGGKIKRSPTYASWQTMRQRCNNPNHTWYRRYGGRGIRICDYWDNFENFLEDMGQRPAHKCLDRINNDGHYLPSNCRWLSIIEQQRNRVSNLLIIAFGETKLLVEWGKDTRCSVSTGQISKRLKAGWAPEKAISHPSAFTHETATCSCCESTFTRIKRWQRFCCRRCRVRTYDYPARVRRRLAAMQP